MESALQKERKKDWTPLRRSVSLSDFLSTYLAGNSGPVEMERVNTLITGRDRTDIRGAKRFCTLGRTYL